MSLRNVQTAFAASLFAKDDDISTYIMTSDSGADPMAIYRNNLYAAHGKALEGIYPVIARLVGEAFFKFAARNYSDAYPSLNGDLNRFGEQFAEFLAAFEYAASLPYLPDVARLEWACHQVYLAGDDPPLDLFGLAAVAPQDYGRLRFRLNRAVRLLRSPWPIDAIWRVNQSDYAGEQSVDLTSGGVSLLIQRTYDRISVTALSAAEWRFLAALDDRKTLASAYEYALTAEPDCDLATLLQQNVAQETLVEFFPRPHEAMP